MAATTSSPVLDRRPMSQHHQAPSIFVGLQRPQAAYGGHDRYRSQSPRVSAQRQQSSISSEDSSGSTSASMVKPHCHPQSYYHASNMEQGFTDEYNEKNTSSWSSPTLHKPSHTPSRQEMAENNSAVLQYIEEQRRAEEEEARENDHAIWILFWMSCLDPIHSLISAIYTLLVILTLGLVSPIRLCRTQTSFNDQIIRSLAPMFRNHLEMIYAPSVEDAFKFKFSPGRLVVVHLTSPITSFGFMLAAWVSAVFWLFTLVMGNPDGTERHDDGRDAVVQVRDWWERYLLNAIHTY